MPRQQLAAAATDAVALHRKRRQPGYGTRLSGLPVADPRTTVSASADHTDRLLGVGGRSAAVGRAADGRTRSDVLRVRGRDGGNRRRQQNDMWRPVWAKTV